ncbi:MAG TPA: hypothetical protein VGH42_03210 [Verrucomicrobiae bacterium]|jgi:hypothetical protein
MKLFLPLTLMIGLLAAGCASGKPAPKTRPVPQAAIAPVIEPIVTPDNSLVAKVVSYNSVGRFVVLSFPVGQMPKMDQTLFLYRAGLKVGKVKITGPQSNNDIVADLIAGDTQVGDEVRDQ